MKRALILHGTDADSKSNWFLWLAEQLQARGMEVWLPDLPHSERPSIKRYNKVLLASDFVFDEDTIIIGHSSGAVAALGLLQALPAGQEVGLMVCVSAFTTDLGWDSLKDLFVEPFNFEKIRQTSKQFLFVHGDDDPWCPLEQAEFLVEQTGGELAIILGGQHFSTEIDPAYARFPKLLELLDERHLL